MKYQNIFPTIIVALLYALGAWFGSLFMDQTGVTPVWPSAGISFAALLLFGWRLLPGVVLGILLGHLLTPAVPPLFLFFSVLTNTLAPALTTWAMWRFGSNKILAVRVRNTLGLLLSGCFLAIISATGGAIGLCLSGMQGWSQFGWVWLSWWLGNLFGVMVCTPAMVSTVISVRRHMAGDSRVLDVPFKEFSLWLILYLVSSGLALWLGQLSQFALALSYLPLAMLVWAALRFMPIYIYLAIAISLLTFLALPKLGLVVIPVPETPADTAILMLFLSTLAILPQVVAAANFERIFLQSKLLYRANHDRLTGLHNRNAFEEHANLTLVGSVDNGEKLAMCYLDMDQFKVVNDTCGHAVGDNLICQIAVVLENNLEPGDSIARMGGDEFAVLLRHCPEEKVSSRADKLRHQVEEFRFAWHKKQFAFTISIGVVILRSNVSFTKQLSLADTACYQAKEAGRNRVKIVTHGDLDISRHHHEVEWVVRINEALANDRFRLYCQPIVPIANKPSHYNHFEVLLRMLDDQGNILMPGAFVPAAERFQLMNKLDRWVVEHTFRWLADHPVCMASVSMCSINLSGPSLSDRAFYHFVKKLLFEVKVPPEKICFEITETAAIGDLGRANRFIKSMRREGCSFALDDFGSGLASFGYLKTLNVDYLKIDGAFVRDIATAPIDLAMVKSINEVGHVMGKKTIAEFVESEAVSQELQKLGVDYAQGFAMGRPLPIEDYFAKDGIAG